MELHTAWGATYPRKGKLSDNELIYVAIACPSSNALRQFATLLSGGSNSSVRLS
jgi:hypothetical protein